MIDTQLILIEGIPCSGKSTTAKRLIADLKACGINSNCFLEWGDNNPIFIGEMEDLSEIISTTKLRENNVLQQWKNFTNRTKQEESVNIIESRFWQTDGMYLYLSGHSEREVFANNQRVISVLTELKPVLIYLAPKDVEQLHTQITKEKNKKWREAGREGSWEDWGNRVYEQQRWFTERLANAKAIARFFNEWVSIAERLYERTPFQKTKIVDPQIDWEDSLDRIRDFLKLKG